LQSLLKGEFIMAIVRYTLEVGKELTSEEHAAMAARLEEASKRPYVYDPDCPLMTEEQLAQFHPINGMTWEERSGLMKEAGLTDPDSSAMPKTKEPAHALDAVSNK
jgi:hypothetical protein